MWFTSFFVFLEVYIWPNPPSQPDARIVRSRPAHLSSLPSLPTYLPVGDETEFEMGYLLSKLHIVALLVVGNLQHDGSDGLKTGVSGPVVVDGESFLDALFASAPYTCTDISSTPSLLPYTDRERYLILSYG
jgi:hypothetical protein